MTTRLRFAEFFAPTHSEEEYIAAMERFMTLDESAQRFMLGCFIFDVHAELRAIGALTQSALGELVHELETALDSPAAPAPAAPPTAPSAPEAALPPEQAPPPASAAPARPTAPTSSKRTRAPASATPHPEPAESADASA